MIKNITTQTPIVKKSNKNLIFIIGFFAAAFVLSCAAFSINQSAMPTDFELTRVSSGGISGSSDTVEIDGDELTHEYSDYPIMYDEYDYDVEPSSIYKRRSNTTETYTLTDDEAKELIKMIKDADFFELDDEYNENECCDMTTVTITITMNDDTKEVTYTMGGRDVPDELNDLDDYIVELSDNAE